jgi:SH3-like domain-containing protein
VGGRLQVRPRWAQNQSVCWGTCAGDPAYLENVDIVPTFVESEYSKIEIACLRAQARWTTSRSSSTANTVWTPDGIAHGAKLRGFVSGQCINCPRKFVEVDAPPEWYGYGDASGGGQVATPSFKVVNVPAADVLNMRAGKDSTFALVAKIPHNADGIVMLDRCDTAWCRVRYRKTEGWVNTAFLTLDWHAAPEVSGPGKVAGKSASVQAPENTEGIKGHVQNSYPYPLDLQSAPNTKASSLGKLPPGATAGMLDRCDPTWCFVRYGKIEGWVNTYRLKILSGASPQYELEKVGGHEYVRRCTVSENAKSCEHLIYHVGVRIALAEIGVPRTVCDPAKRRSAAGEAWHGAGLAQGASGNTGPGFLRRHKGCLEGPLSLQLILAPATSFQFARSVVEAFALHGGASWAVTLPAPFATIALLPVAYPRSQLTCALL